MLIWIAIIATIIIALVLLKREVYFLEGIHLGRRVQGWLYDSWAERYDSDKKASQAHDGRLLAAPLLAKLAAGDNAPRQPLTLDVATGTGRAPLALLSEPNFTGRVIGLDISGKMLQKAAVKLSPYAGRTLLMRCGSMPLPFPDNTFDAASCLEALELMPDAGGTLSEMARVLRPGGVLLTSRGRENWGHSRVRSPETLTALLHEAGFENVVIMPWWEDFDRVWANKPA